MSEYLIKIFMNHVSVSFFLECPVIPSSVHYKCLTSKSTTGVTPYHPFPFSATPWLPQTLLPLPTPSTVLPDIFRLSSEITLPLLTAGLRTGEDVSGWYNLNVTRNQDVGAFELGSRGPQLVRIHTVLECSYFECPLSRASRGKDGEGGGWRGWWLLNRS